MKQPFANKTVGFWVTVAVSVLSAVTAAVYGAVYGGGAYFNAAAFALAIAACPVGIAAALSPLHRYAGYVQFLLTLTALMCYAYGIYYYVSVVLVGIDLQGFGAEFFACTALFALTAAGSGVCVFLKQRKEAPHA